MVKERPPGFPLRTTVFALLLTGAMLVSSLVAVPSLPPKTAGSLAGPSASPTTLAAEPRVPVPYVSGAPPGATETGAYTGTAYVFVAFTLSHAAELQAFLVDLQNPRSPEYHHYLTQQEFTARFSPPSTPYAEATSYFRSVSGLNVTTYGDRIGMLVEGPAAAVGSAFGITLASFTLGGRGTFYAPLGNPALPAPIALAVAQLEGLSSYVEAQSMVAGAAPLGALPSGLAHPNAYPSPVPCGLSQCIYGSDLQVAYDEQTLLNITYPTSERVATILWAGCTVPASSTCPLANLTGGYYPSDVYGYYNSTIPIGEPHSTVIGVPFDGAPAPGVGATFDVSGAVLENTLDLDMVGSLAPGSTIYNVYGVNQLNSETDAAMAYILNDLPSINVISNSWGAADHSDAAWESYMQSAAAQGITVLAASGDSGDSPFSSRYPGTNTEFPSSVGFDGYGVVGVGGTTLTLNTDQGTYRYLHIQDQVAWYDTTFNGYVGSAGGGSPVYSEPSWQRSSEANTYLNAWNASGQRGTPDIAAIGNNTLIYLTVNGTATPTEEIVWGTSIAAPVSAGLFAEINAILARYSQPAVGFADPAIYTWADAMVQSFINTSTTGYVFAGPWPTTLPSIPFDDVTQGRNFVYTAAPGYDLITGWGSLDAYNFTTFILSYNYTGQNFSLNGVRNLLDLTGLNVTSPGVSFNASVQQNFFLANSLGAPLYWIQNVIYIAGSPSTGWDVNYTGWVNFPFYGLYPSNTVYEYNWPLSGSLITTPITWTITSWISNNGPQAIMNFDINGLRLQLPVPGAAYIIGGYQYRYYWQGQEISNGPYTNNPYPGGLAPQFGLVGGPSAGQGFFHPDTGGTLTNYVEASGQSQFVLAPSASVFGPTVDQTGEIAFNLNWTGSGANWNLGVSSGSNEQGVLSYTAYDAGNPANESPSTPTVTFNESGLVPGTNWVVTLGNLTEGCTVGTSGGPCGSTTMRFLVANGIYQFNESAAGYTATTPSGIISVNGVPITQSMQYTASSTFALSFLPIVGLPQGTSWNVTITGVGPLGASSPNPIIFPGLAPGVYHFTVGAISGYRASPSSSTFTLGTSDASQAVSFAPLAGYSITFTESGLPGGTAWAVTVTGQGTQTDLAGGAIVFGNLSNARYSFSVGSVAGYTASPAQGSVTVFGANVTEPITFVSSSGFTITFTETGLPGNTAWSVTVSSRGTQSNSTGGPIVFLALVNGQYSFSVGPISGYTASPSQGTVAVLNANASRAISFSSSGGGGSGGISIPPFTLFGLSGWNLLITILAIFVVCAAVAVVSAYRARRQPSSGEAATPLAPPPPPSVGPSGPEGAVAAPPPTLEPPPPPPPPPVDEGSAPLHPEGASMVAAPSTEGAPSAPSVEGSTASGGPPSPAPRTCPRCGNPVEETSRFCVQCGAPLGEPRRPPG